VQRGKVVQVQVWQVDGNGEPVRAQSRWEYRVRQLRVIFVGGERRDDLDVPRRARHAALDPNGRDRRGIVQGVDQRVLVLYKDDVEREGPRLFNRDGHPVSQQLPAVLRAKVLACDEGGGLVGRGVVDRDRALAVVGAPGGLDVVGHPLYR